MTEDNKSTRSRRPSQTNMLVFIVPLAILFGMFLGYTIWGEPPVPIPTEQIYFDVPIELDDPSRGSVNAPVTIIEFADFECSWCQQYYNETYHRIIEEFGAQIRYVFKDYPIESIHPNAFSAAVAAQCAHEQGAFWDYHDLLFEGSAGLGKEAYLTYAEELDLDMTAFTECVEEDRYASRVNDDLSLGYSVNVSGTPTFFINGKILVGAQPYNVIAQEIRNALAGE